MIETAIKRAVDGHDLDRDEMHRVFSEVMDGRATDVQTGATLPMDATWLKKNIRFGSARNVLVRL